MTVPMAPVDTNRQDADHSITFTFRLTFQDLLRL